MIGGIEAGGTKILCAVGESPAAIRESARFATGRPGATMAEVCRFFGDAREKYGPLEGLGIGTFGPAGVNPEKEDYGKILTTPKEGWSGFDFLGALREGFGGEAPPMVFETDVNAAAVGEAVHGAAVGFEHVAYVTVGTGIGGGFLHGGVPLHGRMHPEIGHFFVPSSEGKGACPFHEDCLEGFASGTAMGKRWGMPGAELGAEHEGWAMEADYLAAGVINLTAAWSPEIVILGGGVSQHEGLIAMVRECFAARAGGYWDLPPMEEYIVAAGLGQQAGIVGALVLAERVVG